MSENASWTVVAIFVVLGVVAIIGGLVWGTNQAQKLGQEVKISCIENGGTWLDYNSMCLAQGMTIKENK